jgi:hypothetical protein
MEKEFRNRIATGGAMEQATMENRQGVLSDPLVYVIDDDESIRHSLSDRQMGSSASRCPMFRVA